MRKHTKTHIGQGLSRFLLTYLVLLLSALMLVHILQPKQHDGTGGSLRASAPQSLVRR